MTSDRELKIKIKISDCPWCPQALPSWKNLYYAKASSGEWAICCYDCGAIGPMGDTKAGARRAWNERLSEEAKA